MEPAAMLIASLKVETLRGPGPLSLLERCIDSTQIRVRFGNRKPTDARVEPDVENVGLLAELRVAAVRAFRICRKQGSNIGRVPGLDAFALEEANDRAVERGI